MAGEQSIQLINALAFAKGTQEPTNRDVLWVDDNIEGSIYTKLKIFNTSSGSWEIISRSNIQLLNDLKTVDGAGSGLDADTLQGYTPAQLMSSGGGGGSVPDLFTGQLLVGQGDTIGTAQTVGGIATIDTSGNLIYIPGTISHADLADIGTFTHAQIDNHINDTANPHGVTASQVGNTTAQWNANSIEGNLTNLGTLGLSEDGYAVVWDNATSRFITAPSSGNNISNADLTWTGFTTQDLNGNVLTFSNGSFVLQGAGTGTGTTLALYDNDTTPNKTWEWLDNGDVNIGQDSLLDLNGNNLTFENGSNITIDALTTIQRTNTTIVDSPIIQFKNFGLSTVYSFGGNGSLVMDRKLDLTTAGQGMGIDGPISVNEDEGILLTGAGYSRMELRGTTANWWVANLESSSFGDAGDFIIHNRLGSLNAFVAKDNGTVLLNSGSSASPIGTEKVALFGETAIQGAGTSTGTTLALYDNDTTPNKTWEWLDSGDVNIGQDSLLDLNGNNLTFENGGDVTINNTEINPQGYIRNTSFTGNDLINLSNTTGSRKFSAASNSLNITFPEFVFQFNSLASNYFSIGSSLSTKWVRNNLLVHNIRPANASTYFYSDGFVGSNNRAFIVGGNSVIGTEKISLQGETAIQGAGTSTGTTLALYDNDTTPNKTFEILDNGNIFTNGNQGFTGTGAYTNFTIENGIITAAS